MWLRRKSRHSICPICYSPLVRSNGRQICNSCKIEIRGSSVKPVADRDTDDGRPRKRNEGRI